MLGLGAPVQRVPASLRTTGPTAIAMISETAQRFLRAVAGTLAADRVVEVHLFSPRRQGHAETGVAVVAVAPLEGATEARHAVYTARYRLLIKGPERGKWEFDCKPEADAPLLTVETVVHGVKERSGDEGEPERLDQAAWRAAIEDGAWATPA